MLESKIIKTFEEWQEWVKTRNSYHDGPFEPWCPNFPVYIVWNDGESNGYNDVSFEMFSLQELSDIQENMND